MSWLTLTLNISEINYKVERFNISIRGIFRNLFRDKGGECSVLALMTLMLDLQVSKAQLDISRYGLSVVSLVCMVCVA